MSVLFCYGLFIYCSFVLLYILRVALRQKDNLGDGIYKALVGKLPNYLMSLLKLKSICHNTRSQSLISLEIPLTKTNIGKIALKFFASHTWNTVQVELKLTKYLSVNQFKSLLDNKDVPQCCCFKWFSDYIFFYFMLFYLFIFYT